MDSYGCAVIQVTEKNLSPLPHSFKNSTKSASIPLLKKQRKKNLEFEHDGRSQIH